MTAPHDRRRSDALADADAIARVLDGDTQQFEHLVRRYQQVLYRHAVSMVLDHDAAADMVQDAFVRAYVNLRQCRDPSRFRAWLFQTLRNRCLDHLKDANRRHLRIDEIVEPPIDESDDPSEIARRHELRARIVRALAQLPPMLREAFVMHYVDGLPYDTMADLLDVSVSALKMRASRARDALSAILKESDVTGEGSVTSFYQAK
jgi:RNA polymerase sigma-70 factor (ECF subfamily)